MVVTLTLLSEYPVNTREDSHQMGASESRGLAASLLPTLFICLPVILWDVGVLPRKQRPLHAEETGEIEIQCGFHACGPCTECSIRGRDRCCNVQTPWRRGILWTWPKPTDGCLSGARMRQLTPLCSRGRWCHLEESEAPGVGNQSAAYPDTWHPPLLPPFGESSHSQGWVSLAPSSQ